MATLDEAFDLAVRYHESGDLQQAEALYRQILQVDPVHGDALYLLGQAEFQSGRQESGVALIRQASALNPTNDDFLFTLGVVLTNQGQAAEARECFRQVVRINPRHVEARNNLGAMLLNLREFPDAREHFEQVLAIHPGNEIARWNLALMRMLQGDLEGGWQDYEQRWALPHKVPRGYQQPRWDGSSLEGKIVLVFAEQGLGDTIQFVRYLPLVKERGGTVLFGCQPALAEICASVAGIDRLIPGGALLPPFDVQVPLLSLPGIFRTTLATIPAAVPYLRANPGLIAAWRREVEPLAGVKVGIAWQGNPKNPVDHLRSLPLAQFHALARLTGVRLLSLQVGHGTEQVAAASFPITDLGNRFEPSSMGDLAAAIMNVDLVITVESAVAHMAGALGVPVWVVLPWSSDWRWLLERMDSPWYPTMRLFRQSGPGDWEEVFERVATELRKLVEV